MALNCHVNFKWFFNFNLHYKALDHVTGLVHVAGL